MIFNDYPLCYFIEENKLTISDSFIVDRCLSVMYFGRRCFVADKHFEQQKMLILY